MYKINPLTKNLTRIIHELKIISVLTKIFMYMKKLKMIVLLPCLLLLNACQQADSQNKTKVKQDNQQDRQLIWSDEFNTDGAPNPDYWTYDLGDNGWGNNEVQNYTKKAENVRVENGHLVIEAHKTADGWTSARLKSQGLKTFTYGKMEIRAKLPKGSGTWPAIWMLGENITSKGWPDCGEIDIMEHVGKDPGQIHGTLHTRSSFGNSKNSGVTSVSDFSEAFHVYGMEWTENKITFMVDDKPYYTYQPDVKNEKTWPFNKPFFFIMNIAMGGNWGSDAKLESDGKKNGIDPNLTSARMEVDYVRVYQ